MTAFQWFVVINTVATAVLSSLALLLYRGFQSGRFVQSRIDDIEALTNRVSSVEVRMETAGQEMSDLADDIQRIPEEMRRVFVSQELFLQVNERNAEDRRTLRADIERLWEMTRGQK